MTGYSIGEVSTLLGVKNHVLRYWEQEVDFLSTRKSPGGHRVYSKRDLQLLMRLNYLVHHRGYTIEGARKKIWDEMTKENPGPRSGISQLRDQLIEVLCVLKKSGNG
ncbi:MAG: MerR family transcriptional regulator [Spirochaetales bacterium]|nr:MerR family transcriptional regulator [Spirochaetales bacterium]